MVALSASGHMPAECLGPASFYRRHYFELVQTDMPRIGPSPRRTMGAENVSDLQLGLSQLAGTYPGR
jgi:hypothetical protein